MRSREKKITRAWLTSPTTGVIALAHDWRSRHKPPLSLSLGAAAVAPHFATLTRLPDYTFGCESAYFVNKKGEIFFFLPTSRLPADIDFLTTAVYLAGDFNGWEQAVGQREWRLQAGTLAGDAVLMLAQRADKFFGQPPMRFKFITGGHRWLDVPLDAPNLIRDDHGNANRFIDPERTGQHRFHFTMAAPLDLAEPWAVRWSEGEDGAKRAAAAGRVFSPAQNPPAARRAGGRGRDHLPPVRAAREKCRAAGLRQPRDAGHGAWLHAGASSLCAGSVGGHPRAKSPRLVLLVPRGWPGKRVRIFRPGAADSRSLCAGHGRPHRAGHCARPRMGGAGRPGFSDARVAGSHHRRGARARPRGPCAGEGEPGRAAAASPA